MSLVFYSRFPVHYWDELKKVIGCFGDSCKDFNLIEDSDFAVEVIKEGFTLEFMKNALIKPVLSLRNKELLLNWWRRVEAGEADVPLPAESDIFKSDNYSTFIYLYFKMATEVNVFAHLGKTLLTHMKESLFSDLAEEEEEDSEEETEQQVTKQEKDVNNEDQPAVEADEAGETATVNGDKTDSAEPVSVDGDQERTETAPSEEKSKPKTITSMYGKVYTVKE